MPALATATARPFRRDHPKACQSASALATVPVAPHLSVTRSESRMTSVYRVCAQLEEGRFRRPACSLALRHSFIFAAVQDATRTLPLSRAHLAGPHDRV
jgi:hypothetical protein